jgi:hypothetical protein
MSVKLPFLYYKHTVHGQLFVLTVKCPYLWTLAREAITLSHFFLLITDIFSRQKNKREKLWTFVRDYGQMTMNVFIIQAPVHHIIPSFNPKLKNVRVTCGLCYKPIVHGHMSVKLHFCVINLNFTSKCL